MSFQNLFKSRAEPKEQTKHHLLTGRSGITSINFKMSLRRLNPSLQKATNSIADQLLPEDTITGMSSYMYLKT